MRDLKEPQIGERDQTLRPWRITGRRIARKLTTFVAGIIGALIVLSLFNVFAPEPEVLTQEEVNDSISEAMASATPPPPDASLVYQFVQPSLVLIQTLIPDENGDKGNGIGSGVVINERSEILTSLHVVAGATEIEVIFADGMRVDGEVVVAQPENDIAVLRPSETPALVVPAVLGNPNAMRVGDEAFVVGNPLGLYSSLSAGVISGFNRSFEPENGDQRLEGLIQIDAAVNPGNSGGPLLNRSGQVIGIVTALANPTEQDVFIGIGFAVPINVASQAANLPPY